MFCPECGEVIGSGPLDIRRAGSSRRRSVIGSIGPWIGGMIGRLSPRSGSRVDRRRRNEEI